MGKVTYIWSEEYVGGRVGIEIPEEGHRGKAYSEKYWSEVELLPRSRLKEIQIQKLKHLLQFAWERSSFYRRKWEERGVKPEDVQSLADFVRFPVLTKEDFAVDQAEHPPFGTACTSPPNTQARYWQTSGSTGKPRLWSDSKEDLENEIFKFSRFVYANGIGPGWRAFYAFPFPPFNGFWLLYSTMEALGCQNVPKGSLATTAWLSLMRNLAGTASSIVGTTPTFAIRQHEVAQEMGLDLHELKIDSITMAGEPGATVPATKKLIEEAWGSKALDVFGSTENGAMAFTCAEQVNMAQPSDHLMIDYHIFELLDPKSMEPVEPGQPGALCVTSLGKFGMPCIRYLLGDYVWIDEETQCPCGRTLPLVRGGIQTRSDDMIIVKGENIYPSLIEECVRSTPGLSVEYRIQKTLTSATVLVEAMPDASADDYKRLADQLQRHIKDKAYVNLDIKVLEPGKLPRELAKTKRIITDSNIS
jgi:phenylacetate-CoA ligase